MYLHVLYYSIDSLHQRDDEDDVVALPLSWKDTCTRYTKMWVGFNSDGLVSMILAYVLKNLLRFQWVSANTLASAVGGGECVGVGWE